MTQSSDYSIELLLLKGLESIVLPPGLFCLLILCCLFLHRKKFSKGLLFITAMLVYLTSVPVTEVWLRGILNPGSRNPIAERNSQAIVVVGGGRYIDTSDYAGDTVNHRTLERLRFAAWVQKQTGLPILVSGGKSFEGAVSEADLMREVLTREFLAQVDWIENASRTTYENAQFSASILKADGIQKIILVTHAYHMPRALEAFQQAGFNVTPAATILFDQKPDKIPSTRWIPSFDAFYRNSMMLHELAGRIWYRIRYYRTNPGGLKPF